MAEVIVFWAFMCAKEGYNSFHEILLEGGQKGGLRGDYVGKAFQIRKKKFLLLPSPTPKWSQFEFGDL